MLYDNNNDSSKLHHRDILRRSLRARVTCSVLDTHAIVYCLLFIMLQTATGQSPLTAEVNAHVNTQPYP